MGGSDGHVDYADLILDLADEDAGFAGVLGHPVEYAGGGAHGICAVELDASRGSAHGHGSVAAEGGVLVVGHGERPGEGLEVLAGVVVSGAGDGDVLVGDGLLLFAELLGDNLLKRGEAYAHHAEGCAHGKGVLGDLVFGDVGQGGDGDGTELDAGGRECRGESGRRCRGRLRRR